MLVTKGVIPVIAMSSTYLQKLNLGTSVSIRRWFGRRAYEGLMVYLSFCNFGKTDLE